MRGVAQSSVVAFDHRLDGPAILGVWAPTHHSVHERQWEGIVGTWTSLRHERLIAVRTYDCAGSSLVRSISAEAREQATVELRRMRRTFDEVVEEAKERDSPPRDLAADLHDEARSVAKQRRSRTSSKRRHGRQR